MAQSSDLPPEFRRQIYQTIISDSVQTHLEKPRPNKDITYDYTGLSAPACLKLSRGILQEVEDVYYISTTFSQLSGMYHRPITQKQKRLRLQTKNVEVTAFHNDRARQLNIQRAALMRSDRIEVSSVKIWPTDYDYLAQHCVSAKNLNVKLMGVRTQRRHLNPGFVWRQEMELNGIVAYLRLLLPKVEEVMFQLRGYGCEEWGGKTTDMKVVAEAMAERIYEGFTYWGAISH